MAVKIKSVIKVLSTSVMAVYPVVVFYFLVIQKTPLRLISLFVIGFAMLAFIAATSRQGRRSAEEAKKNRITPVFLPSLFLFGIGIACLITDSDILLKLYPLLINLLFLGTFTLTLFQPPAMIYRFAILADKTISGSPGEKQIAAYCKKVTIVWICFFVLNGSAAAWTIFFGSDLVWSIYNGGISYILMGTLFAGEFMVRKMVQKKIPGTRQAPVIPLTAINKNSRKLSHVLCYEGAWKDGKHKTWEDFLKGTAALRRQIQAVNSDRWLLYCDDCWSFLLAFTSLLQCKKEVLLTVNLSPEYILEIRNTEQGLVPFLTDQSLSNILYIPDLLKTADEENTNTELPVINADETSIIMFTSGSTGKPKAIKQRLTELENDNHFTLSKWGDELIGRKHCSTVNHHHIYGLLFSILLPFTVGVPFKQKRIEVPEEFEKLTDTKYTIVTVPAFLKRAVEIESQDSLKLISPWIFSAGGVLTNETAEKTSKIFGFWPVEIYGSTETSGIAWRQSSNGPEWTPFDNAQLSRNSEGCLIIRSPYIKDPAGFETADIVELMDDGRFLLKGRIDSIVKIEEKRISVTEMEERIFQSGLVSSVCVIPLEDKRQYLAATVVLNDRGKEQFSKTDKYNINKYWKDYLLKYFESMIIPRKWRYPEALPTDSQGKIKKEAVRALFTDEKYNFNKILEKTDNSVMLEISVPAASPYFDGHFPEFQVLPGVAQIELVIRFASQYFGTGIAVSEIKRVKFTNLVLPSSPLIIKINKIENTISFKIYSPENEQVYSSGSLILMQEQI